MARIAISCSNGRYRATLAGSVTFEDLAQLERSCGPALERHRPPLTLDITAVDSIDRVARLFLHHLEVRGVEIVTARQQP